MQNTIKDLSTPFQPLTNGIFSLETNFVSYIIKQEIKWEENVLDYVSDTSHMNNLVYWITDMFSRMMNHYNVSLYYPLDECDISHNSDSHRHVLTRKYVHGRDEHFSNKRGHEGISKGLLSPLGSLTQHTGLNNSRETYPTMSTSQITRPSIFDILTKVHNDLTTILVVTTANLWSM